MLHGLPVFRFLLSHPTLLFALSALPTLVFFQGFTLMLSSVPGPLHNLFPRLEHSVLLSLPSKLRLWEVKSPSIGSLSATNLPFLLLMNCSCK